MAPPHPKRDQAEKKTAASPTLGWPQPAMKPLAGEIPLTLVGEPRAWIVDIILGFRLLRSHDRSSPEKGVEIPLL